MKIEPLHLVSPVNGHDDAVTNPPNGRHGGVNGDEGAKTPRLPRWTRQEILRLIQGKRVAESRVKKGRVGGLEFGSGQVEPKWSMISSYCRKHGVNRGPVQCRKRWSNLAGDFKKIKEFESKVGDESESFWFMRNDLRREKKLPGFFDKEVYEILCNGGGGGFGGEEGGVDGRDLALALGAVTMEVEPESVFDSGRTVAIDDGLFSDFDQSGQDGGGSPVKEAPQRDVSAPTPISVGTDNGREPALDEGLGSTQGVKKRKRHTPDEDEEETHWHQHLIKTLESNGKLLSSQLETQNNRYQLEREQQKDHANNLVAVLSKVADALGKIADKL